MVIGNEKDFVDDDHLEIKKEIEMKMKMIAASVVCVLVFAVSVGAQGYSTGVEGFSLGDNFFTLTGSGSSDNEFDNSNLGAGISFGHFYSDVVAGEIRQSVNFYDVPGNNNQWNGSTRVALDYYLGSGKFSPFVGANTGYVYGDQVSDTWVAGPEAGFRSFLNETTYVYLMAEYQFFFNDSSEVNDAFNDGRFEYSVGLGLKF